MNSSKSDYNVLAATKYVPNGNGNGKSKSNPMDIEKIFGENAFGLDEMKARLPEDIYGSILATIEHSKPLDPEIADTVATAMKEWAVERGATHYTHWFQPLTGSTAEKHDSFITPEQRGAEPWPSSQGKNLRRVNRMPRVSRAAVYGRRLKPVVTLYGIRLLRHLSSRTKTDHTWPFRQRSPRGQGRHSTTRFHFCVHSMRSIGRPCGCWDCST